MKEKRETDEASLFSIDISNLLILLQALLFSKFEENLLYS